MEAGNHVLSGFEFLQVGIKASTLQYGGELSRDVSGTIKHGAQHRRDAQQIVVTLQ